MQEAHLSAGGRGERGYEIVADETALATSQDVPGEIPEIGNRGGDAAGADARTHGALSEIKKRLVAYQPCAAEPLPSPQTHQSASPRPCHAFFPSALEGPCDPSG